MVLLVFLQFYEFDLIWVFVQVKFCTNYCLVYSVIRRIFILSQMKVFPERKTHNAWIRRFSWSVFSRIWTEYGKIRTRKNSVLEHFSHSATIKKQLWEVFYIKRVLKNFAKFTGTHLCESLFSNNFAGLRQITQHLQATVLTIAKRQRKDVDSLKIAEKHSVHLK